MLQLALCLEAQCRAIEEDEEAGFGHDGTNLRTFLRETLDAKVGMNSGAMFGKGGVGFMRLNVGCPRSTVNEAIDRIVKACSSLAK